MHRMHTGSQKKTQMAFFWVWQLVATIVPCLYSDEVDGGSVDGGSVSRSSYTYVNPPSFGYLSILSFSPPMYSFGYHKFST